MDLKIFRSPVKNKPTMGRLEIDGSFFCFTLEDEDKGLTQDMEVSEIVKLKKYGETCIPYGKYKVQVTPSPRFKRNLPLIKDVKGFIGIRIHRGNYETDSLGCPLVGFERSLSDFQLMKSKLAEEQLIKVLGLDEHDLEIVRSF